MNTIIPDDAGRVILEVNKEITLDLVNCANGTRTFKIVGVLGSGGTAIAYKVSYDGADNNRYLYVLKELYPIPAEGKKTIRRFGASLDIDEYDDSVTSSHHYKRIREQFEAAYHIQIQMATGEDAVACMTTSLPIGLYEDRASSEKGNYAVYGLFQYQVGKTLKGYTEKSLLELIDIQRKIAEVVKSYHEHGFLWLDIQDANVNTVGAGAVQSVSMFDFGSIFPKLKLMNYCAATDQDPALSFSPGELIPLELKALLPKETACDISKASAKNNKKYEKRVKELGQYGEKTVIFLLGALLFKRLMGKTPTLNVYKNCKDLCTQIQTGLFDMTHFELLKGYSDIVVSKIREILVQCLNYDNRGERYESVSTYMADLNELYLELCTQEGLAIVEGNARNYVTVCCKRYLNTILNGDTDGKFKHLKKLQGRFVSRVSLRSDSNQKTVLPSTAIDSAPSLEGSRNNNHLVFLYGDGGMGKSTALYDYMREAASTTSIYIELSQYRFIDRDTSFIFKKIFEDICKKFIDAAGFIEKERLSRAEDILLESLSVLDQNDPRPQYVLLLDGYNEITREDRGGFDVEIAKIIDTWKNCRIVITGRNLPRDYEGRDISTYEHFNRFEFIGISEEERRALIEKKYPDRIEKIHHDEHLWDALRIPMFMGMFIQFDSNLFNNAQGISIHTRGEILDHFITRTEIDAAKLIATRQTGNAENALLRSFLVHYGLPIIANEMDTKRSFGLSKLQLINDAKSAWKVYDDEGGLMVGCLLDINVPDEQNVTNKLIFHLFNVEAGYCYKTTDGTYSFIHQYFRDYFAAKHIQNILNAAQALGNNGLSKDEQLQFVKDNGLDYTWSDDVCIMLGEIIGDYKNEPGYSEE